MRRSSPKLAVSRATLVFLCTTILCALIIIGVSLQSGVFFRSDESLSIGKQAPAFRSTDFDGSEIVLYDVIAENEYVLLEFWASWCGPCVAKLPELKTLYSQYDKGVLEVISIAREASHLEWTEASAEYDLPWINLAELGETRGDVGDAYGLSGLPQNHLVSKDGTIVANNISVEELATVMRKHVSALADDNATSTQ